MNKKNRGEANGYAHLTEQIVREIRRAYGIPRGSMKHYHSPNGITMTELGRRYGIRHTHVSQIVHRKLWKHVR